MLHWIYVADQKRGEDAETRGIGEFLSILLLLPLQLEPLALHKPSDSTLLDVDIWASEI